MAVSRWSGGGRGATTVFRGPPAEEKPAILPVAGSRMLSKKPPFAWPAVPKAKGYRIQVACKAKSDRIVLDIESAEARLPYPVEKSRCRAAGSAFGTSWRWSKMRPAAVPKATSS